MVYIIKILAPQLVSLIWKLHHGSYFDLIVIPMGLAVVPQQAKYVNQQSLQ